MHLLHGTEAQLLKQLRDDLEENKQTAKSQSDVSADARRRKAGADLPEQGISQVRLDEQNARLEELRDTEQNLLAEQKRLVEMQEKADATLRALSDVGDAQTLDRINLAALDDISDFHYRAEDVRSQQSAVKARLELLGPQELPGDVTSMTEGLHILRQWFEAGPVGCPVGTANSILVWLLAALLALLGIVLAVNVSLWWLLLLLLTSARHPPAWARHRVSLDNPLALLIRQPAEPAAAANPLPVVGHEAIHGTLEKADSPAAVEQESPTDQPKPMPSADRFGQHTEPPR